MPIYGICWSINCLTKLKHIKKLSLALLHPSPFQYLETTKSHSAEQQRKAKKKKKNGNKKILNLNKLKNIFKKAKPIGNNLKLQ